MSDTVSAFATVGPVALGGACEDVVPRRLSRRHAARAGARAARADEELPPRSSSRVSALDGGARPFFGARVPAAAKPVPARPFNLSVQAVALPPKEEHVSFKGAVSAASSLASPAAFSALLQPIGRLMNTYLGFQRTADEVIRGLRRAIPEKQIAAPAAAPELAAAPEDVTIPATAADGQGAERSKPPSDNNNRLDALNLFAAAVMDKRDALLANLAQHSGPSLPVSTLSASSVPVLSSKKTDASGRALSPVRRAANSIADAFMTRALAFIIPEAPVALADRTVDAHESALEMSAALAADEHNKVDRPSNPAAPAAAPAGAVFESASAAAHADRPGKVRDMLRSKVDEARDALRKHEKEAIEAVEEKLKHLPVFGQLQEPLIYQSLELAIRMAQSPNSDNHLKRVAASTLASLAAESDEHREAIVAYGGIPVLLGLLGSTACPEVQAQAACAVGRLSLNTAIRDLIVDRGGVQALKFVRDSVSRGVPETHATIRAKAKACRALAMMGENERVCKLPGATGLRILSLDGGGTRGIVTVQILKELERLCGLPIHSMFDMVAGTSTGGIIAYLVGLKNRTMEEIDQLYMELAAQIFSPGPHPVVSAGRMAATSGYYDAGAFERILQREGGFDPLMNTADDAGACKTFAIATLLTRTPQTMYLFRNYTYGKGSESRYPGSSTHALWEALRATCAAPTYFPEYVSGPDVFSDGSMLANNPSGVALQEAKAVWGPSQPLECLLSIGTGMGTVERACKHSGLLNIGRVLKSSATNTEYTHSLLTDLLPAGTYYRFNPPIADEKLADALDEARPEKLAELKQLASDYLATPEVAAQLRQLAATLNPALRDRRDRRASAAADDRRPPSPAERPAPFSLRSFF